MDWIVNSSLLLVMFLFKALTRSY